MYETIARSIHILHSQSHTHTHIDDENGNDEDANTNDNKYPPSSSLFAH